MSEKDYWEEYDYIHSHRKELLTSEEPKSLLKSIVKDHKRDYKLKFSWEDPLLCWITKGLSCNNFSWIIEPVWYNGVMIYILLSVVLLFLIAFGIFLILPGLEMIFDEFDEFDEFDDEEWE